MLAVTCDCHKLSRWLPLPPRIDVFNQRSGTVPKWPLAMVSWCQSQSMESDAKRNHRGCSFSLGHPSSIASFKDSKLLPIREQVRLVVDIEVKRWLRGTVMLLFLSNFQVALSVMGFQWGHNWLERSLASCIFCKIVKGIICSRASQSLGYLWLIVCRRNPEFQTRRNGTFIFIPWYWTPFSRS